jgi:hypothetical protein
VHLARGIARARFNAPESDEFGGTSEEH